MTSPIQGQGGFLSFNSLKRDLLSESMPNDQILERALLCLRKANSVHVPRDSFRSGESNIGLDPEWIDNIIKHVTHPDPPQKNEEDLILETKEFLSYVTYPYVSNLELLRHFQSLDPLCQKLLSWLVWHAHGRPEGDPQYGEKQILADPTILLSLVQGDRKQFVKNMMQHINNCGGINHITIPLAIAKTREAYLTSLEHFLLALQTTPHSHEDLRAIFQTLDPFCQTLLCWLVWHADGRPEGDPQYGKNQILADPTILLHLVNSDGDNLVECIMQYIYQSGYANEPPELSNFQKYCYGSIFIKIEEPISTELFSEAAFYHQIAKVYVNCIALKIRKSTVEEFKTKTQIKNIKNTKLKEEIIKILAQENPVFILTTAKELNITNQTTLLATARSAIDFGIDISAYLPMLRITDDVKIELLKLSAENQGNLTARNIKKWEISDPLVLKEVALICAHSIRNNSVAEYIPDFEIDHTTLEGQTTLITIAEKLVQSNYISPYIQNFKIDPNTPQGQDALINIAKISAERDGYYTASYIQHYNINPKYPKGYETLKHIAQLCALDRPALKDNRIQIISTHFSMLSEKDQNEIKTLAVMDMISHNNLSKEGEAYFQQYFYPLCREIILHSPNAFLRKAPDDPGTKIFSEEDLAILRTEDNFSPQLSRQSIAKLHKIYFIFQILADKPIPEELKETLAMTLAYRNPSLSHFYFKMVSTYIHHDDFIKHYAELIPISSLRLPMLPIAKWLTEGGSEETAISIRDSLKHHKLNLKNADTGILQLWLMICQALENRTELTPSQKIKCLQNILSQKGKEPLSKEELKNRLSMLYCLCKLEHTDKLTPIIELLPEEDIAAKLSELVAKEVLEDTYLNLQGDPEFIATRYAQTFGRMREPNSWKIYEMELQTLEGEDRESVQRAFQYATRHILNDTHREARYQATSQHISKIMENSPKIWEKWAKKCEGRLVTKESSSQESSLFSFQDFLKQKWQDDHLKGLAALTKFFENSDAPEKQKELWSICTEEALKSEDPLLQAQATLMELYLDPTSSTELLASQNKIKQIAQELAGHEIAHDLTDLLISLRQPSEEDVFVIDTDDWEDLVLSGTEVAGSCQRVDGLVNLNKCLLAYIIDGKNRMLAVKNPATGKILARCIFRLLWDGNNRRPVLFQDRIYPFPCPSDYVKHLNDLAKERARELGLPLYTQEILQHDTKPSNNVIQSYGSLAPFEYEDGAEGVMQNGVFTITA